MYWTDLLLRTSFFWAALALTIPFCAAVAQTPLPTVDLSVGAYHIRAEVAATFDSRDKGLMGRQRLPVNKGMLFVFPEAHRHCMWMHDTYIPLSVAFIDDNGEIVNIAEMQPGTEDYHCAEKPVRHALEMGGGWFQSRGIVPGRRILGVEKVLPGR